MQRPRPYSKVQSKVARLNPKTAKSQSDESQSNESQSNENQSEESQSE